MILLQAFLFLIAGYFLFYSFFLLGLILTSTIERKRHTDYINEQNPEVLIILPAYKPGAVFMNVLNAVEQVSKARDIQVYVLLQNAEYKYKEYADAKGFFVEEQTFDHLGGNSYQHALRHVSKVIQREIKLGRWNPEFVMIVDKDNLLSADFFNNIPERIYEGFDVIQGRRSPLGTQSAIAFFDNLSERLNDRMLRSAKETMGSMIEISGSGALIETDLYINAIHKLDINAPGFDKNFMIQLLTSERDVRTTFWTASELKEEKTAELDVHNPQRVRWFGEQYYNALFHGRALFSAFRKHKRFGALDYLLTLWRPPRSVQFIFVPLLGVAEAVWFFISGSWPLQFPLFILAALVLAVAAVVFLLKEGILLQALKHSTKLPALAFHNFFNALRSIRKENRGTFIHTTHKL